MLVDHADTNKETPQYKFQFSDFSGGLCRNSDPSGIADNEYALLVNGRNRYGNLAPIKGPTDRTSEIPAGFMQSLYGYDSIMLLFVSGQAYAKDFAQANSAFQLIPGALMNDKVDVVYTEAVPASWFNIQRKLVDGSDAGSGVTFYSEVFGTPSAIICQDGITQPKLIFTTGFCRPAHTFAEWSNLELMGADKREYVPVGKQMHYSAEGILYTISPDGKEIYRSVTGRPLDHVIAIDQDGDKLPPLTSGKEEASRLSYKLDYNPITCIKGTAAPPSVESEGQGFFVSTRTKSWIVYPDYATTVFGEPTFSNQPLFSTGALNQFSFTDILGDVAITTESGITSFNSVLNVGVEGKNAPFHEKIFKLFELGSTQILQTQTASFTSDNYAFLAVDTVYGAAILVYDTLRKQYTSVDIYPEVEGKIKQFAEVKYGGQRYLYFITTGNQLFEAFTGETLTMRVYLKEVMAESAEKELIPRRVRIVLDSIQENGTITLTPFTDSKAGTAMTRSFAAPDSIPTIPIAFPFGSSEDDDVSNKTFKIEQPIKGDRIGLYIELTGQAEIYRVEFVSDIETKQVSQQEAGEIFGEAKPVT